MLKNRYLSVFSTVAALVAALQAPTASAAVCTPNIPTSFSGFNCGPTAGPRANGRGESLSSGAKVSYRARMLAFAFDAVDTTAPHADVVARQNALARARALARALASDPARFDEADGERLLMQWEEGRALSALGAALGSLRIGQITLEPVLSEYGFVVAQRLEPGPVEPMRTAHELPAPAEPDPAHFFGSMSAGDVASFLRTFAAQARGELGLGGAVATQLDAAHDLGGRLDDTALPAARMRIVNDVLDDTRRLLGENRYGQYRATLSRVMAELLLGAPADSPAERGF